MILENYYNPNDKELQHAFEEIYDMLGSFSTFEKIIILFLMWKMKDRLYKIVAQKLHRNTMSTLHRVDSGVYYKWFKKQRENKKKIKEESKNWVKSTIVE